MRRWAVLLIVFFALPIPSQAATLGTIEVTVVPTRHHSPRLPVGRAGDAERLVWSVRDRWGRTIGVGVFSCRWVLQQARLCTGDIAMPLGKISIIGSSPTRELGVWSVVGGTGHYVGAKGELVFRAIGLRKLVVSMTV